MLTAKYEYPTVQLVPNTQPKKHTRKKKKSGRRIARKKKSKSRKAAKHVYVYVPACLA
jgi:hypothetical protein